MSKLRVPALFGVSLFFLSSVSLSATGAVASDVPVPAIGGVVESGVAELDEDLVTFEVLDFAHPVSLESAVTVLEGAGAPISGYHFVSDSIVGDFWLDGGLTAEEFLAEIELKTGTAPEVVSAYVEPAELRASGVERRLLVSVPLGADLPVYDAPDADLSLMEGSDSLGSAEALRDDVDISLKAAGDTWQPTDAEVMVMPMGDNLSITAKYYWTGLTPFSSALVMANKWGMEFQVDFYSSRVVNSPTPGPHARPNCGTSHVNYKDWAAASNRPFDWFGYVISGGNHVVAPGGLGLYGDYNDLSDPCTVSTIAVGMANPHAMTASPIGDEYLGIYAYPKKGVEAKSRVGAIVQPVNRAMCEQFPSMPLTDCMGVIPGAYPGPGPTGNRMVLNSANNNQAPSLCWYSPNFGTTSAQIWTC